MNDTVARVLARARERLELMQDFSDDLGAIRSRATSDDGMVTATVNERGALVDLEFDPAVRDVTPAEFGKALVQASDAAMRAALAEKVTLIETFNAAIAD